MRTLSVTFLIALLCLFGVMSASADSEGFDGVSAQRTQQAAEALQNLTSENPGVKAYRQGSMVTRLYGRTFATGSSPEATAESFRREHATAFGVDAEDLISGSLTPDKRSSQPVMWQPDRNAYKFSLHYYTQQEAGVPVFQSELRVLVRNEPGYPAVLAVSTLRDLDGFQPDKGLVGAHSAIAQQAARADEPSLTDFSEQKTVIYAGIDNLREQPRMAVVFEGSSDYPERFRFVVDPTNGEILYKENLIVHENVTGTISGEVTEGNAAEHCEEEVPVGLPYVRVTDGTTTVYTDSTGYYDLPIGDGQVSAEITSELWGQWFRVYNWAGSDVELVDTVLAPGPGNFMHNDDNDDELIRSQANAYYLANIERDVVLQHNPAYPDMMDPEFPIYCNRTDGYCPGNAWYDPGDQSMNFCQSGDGHPNTAWSSVLHHEFGHHLINVGGSGQGQYGEGMSDCLAMIMSDDPNLGLGFFGPCGTPLRNADNSYQYPCSGSIHDCGQLLSGCVWDTREELIITEPADYMDILGGLVINSILLHTGTEITPQITIDFLTLDDDDANLNNGTPHYDEIATGFGLHNMPAPELAPLVFEYPNGVPEELAPSTTVTFEVIVSGLAGTTPVSGTGKLYYSVDGDPLVTVDMTELSTNHYEATLPATDCFSLVEYYVSADEVSVGTVFDPGASSPFKALTVTSSTSIMADDFETDQGWSVSGDATDGQWTRGVPVGGGDRGDPATDYDGSGACYLTDNVDDNSDVDGGTTYLISPQIDLSAGDATIKYARWYSNNAGASPNADEFYVSVSNDDGASWTTVETVGPVDQANGGWYESGFVVSEFVTPTSQIRVRFEASDLGSASVVEAGVDAFEVIQYDCQAGPVAIATETLPDWTVDQTYYQTLEAVGGGANRVWDDKYGDLVGTGLTLSTDGVISGTPTAVGTISFTAHVVDDFPSEAEKPLSIVINDMPSVTTASLPDWTIDQPYSYQLEATDGTGDMTYSDHNDGLVGSGLTLSESGLVSGTPTSVQIVALVARVTDETGATADGFFSFQINAAVEVTTTTVPDWTAGQPMSEQLTATGGTGSLTFTDFNGDLAGSGLTLGTDGLLGGTPTSDQVLGFTAVATDQVGAMDAQPLTFTINPAVSITTTALPDAEQNAAYSMQLQASGGTGLMAWEDVNDDLDGTGLTLSVSGELSGTPTGSDSVYFTASVTDVTGSTSQQAFGLHVEASWICGDVNGDGAGPNIADLTAFVDYLFNSGAEPPVLEALDIDGTPPVNISDLTYMVSYLFDSGDAPQCQ